MPIVRVVVPAVNAAFNGRGKLLRIGDVDAPAVACLRTAIDAIALGCTHYTFLLPEFEALYPHIAWFDPALPVARRTFAVTQEFAALPAAQGGTAYFTAALPDFTIMQARLDGYGFTAQLF